MGYKKCLQVMDEMMEAVEKGELNLPIYFKEKIEKEIEQYNKKQGVNNGN